MEILKTAGMEPAPERHKKRTWSRWMEQIARNLTDAVDVFLKDARYLTHDRSSLFTPEFATILRGAGVKTV